MPAFTSPDNIVYPVPSDPIEPLNAIFQDLADSTQAALTAKIPGEWASWTPTFENIDTTGAVINANYAQIGKTIYGIFSMTFGAETVIVGAPKISTPTSIEDGCLTVGQLRIVDESTSAVFRGAVNIDDNSFCPRLFTVSGTYITETAISDTVPFTWTVGDTLGFYFLYESV